MGFDPKTIRGIGIYDASVGWGLRAAGYTAAEILDVLAFRARILRGTTRNFDTDIATAKKVWEDRVKSGGYWLMEAGFNVAPAIVHVAVEDAAVRGNTHDADPMIITAPDGMVHTVRHIGQAVIDHLMRSVDGHTFVFGTRNCWGVDNSHGDAPHVKIEQVIHALDSAPR